MDATENGLSSLPPPYVWKSRGVKDIRMNGNQISRVDLSDCGRYWPHLELLYLGQNKIKEVCVCVCVCVCTLVKEAQCLLFFAVLCVTIDTKGGGSAEDVELPGCEPQPRDQAPS